MTQNDNRMTNYSRIHRNRSKIEANTRNDQRPQRVILEFTSNKSNSFLEALELGLKPNLAH